MELYLVAFLLPPVVSEQVWALKQQVHQLTGSRNAVRLPPHITLMPPLRRPPEFGEALARMLATYAAGNRACLVQLRDFAWFQQRTLYVHVQQTPGLLALHQQFYQLCAQELPAVPQPARRFVPHVTLATRDIPPHQVPALQELFAHRRFAADMELHELVLFRHTGQQWLAEVLFQLAPASTDYPV
ncbi:2'-5' RNA ligase family protein [Hymenobacter pini]|uniref:2'-5' RNA ligase family protein n=1 Tax=Hymenobacter pini TaxID=2880879 RepID=UPI001CF51BA3|nr:2'-5' RNA ligase family protein [Hymenobacter pini]MCA8830045.1 2'-5' RNA ligase family protein [Hymenobacter pini]